MQAPRDLAAKRINARQAFRRYLLIYLVVNAALIVTWAALVLGGWSGAFHIMVPGSDTALPGNFFWPVFPIVGWGIGVATRGYGAYHNTDASEDQIQREMRKLM
jgi:2TM domain-containing protein